MKKLLIVLSFGFISCGQEPKKIASAQPEITSPEEQQISTSQSQNNSTDGDPTFTVPPDTISAYGPRSITRCVLQDKNGIIWFATWEGIISYDGKAFTNVTLKEGLKHFHVCCILEDNSDSNRNGDLWFGTVGGGVYRYDHKNFTLFSMADGLVGNAVMCMLKDRAGNIWFGTTEGVSRYNGNTFTNFSKEDGLGDNFISSIAQDRTGKIWFGTNGGVSCYEDGVRFNNGKSFTDFKNKKEDWSFHNVRSVFEDRTGKIWIGSAEGLFRSDGKSLSKISNNSPSYIFEDKNGNLWLNAGGTNRPSMVLYRYEVGKKEPAGETSPFTEIIVSKDPKPAFFNQIFGITEDRDGNIWFGTASGACRYDGKSFNRFTEGAPEK